MASAWRNFKNIFSRPLFTIIFRPKIVILDTDSILRVKKMYELVKKDVLRLVEFGTIFAMVVSPGNFTQKLQHFCFLSRNFLHNLKNLKR